MNPLMKDIAALAESVSGLARRAVAEYSPLVDTIISGRSTDIGHIEHTLDGLLDFCFDPEVLLLYKKRDKRFLRAMARRDRRTKFEDPRAAATSKSLHSSRPPHFLSI
jgi:hypothetical protein